MQQLRNSARLRETLRRRDKLAVDQHGYCAALSLRLDITRKYRRRRRQFCARGDAMFAAEISERALAVRHGQKIEQFPRRRRHERLRQNRDLPQHLGGHIEHGALPRRIGLGQRPRRLAGEIAVGVGHHRPDRVEHLMQLLRRHRVARLADHGVGGARIAWSLALNAPGAGSTPPKLRPDHGERALRQIAEIVGEIGIDAIDDGLVAVIAVLAERHLAQQEIAQRIDTVSVGQRERIDHVADRFRHFLAAIEQKAVGENAARHLDARRHQERRPVHRVKAHDVLADDVQVGRPIFLEHGAVGIGIADGGDVVGQRIDPNVHDVLVVVRHLDAPVEGGARQRQILQAAAHEACDFVHALPRQHEIRHALVEIEQPVGEGGELEEIALLLDPFDRRALRAERWPLSSRRVSLSS